MMGAKEPGQIIGIFEDKFNSGDLDGLMELYEDDAVFPGEDGLHVGKDAIRGAVKAFLDTGGKLQFSGNVVFQAGDIALTHNAWKLSGDTPLEGATAEVTRKGADGNWRYIIDNPFGTAVLET
jgi:ketosteroid isomerase-like protein